VLKFAEEVVSTYDQNNSCFLSVLELVVPVIGQVVVILKRAMTLVLFTVDVL